MTQKKFSVLRAPREHHQEIEACYRAWQPSVTGGYGQLAGRPSGPTIFPPPPIASVTESESLDTTSPGKVNETGDVRGHIYSSAQASTHIHQQKKTLRPTEIGPQLVRGNPGIQLVCVS